MKFKKLLIRCGILVSIICISNSSLSQSLRIDITGVGQTQMPIALAPFYSKTKSDEKFGQIINDVIQSNLRRTAAFNILPLPPLNPALSSNVELSDDFFNKWRNLGTHALVIGDIASENNLKNIGIKFRLLDTLRAIDLGGLSSNNDFDTQLEEQLLEMYFEKKPSSDLFIKYNAMKTASLLRETMWSMVSEITSKIDFDYGEYTSDNLTKFNNAFERLK